MSKPTDDEVAMRIAGALTGCNKLVAGKLISSAFSVIRTEERNKNNSAEIAKLQAEVERLNVEAEALRVGIEAREQTIARLTRERDDARADLYTGGRGK